MDYIIKYIYIVIYIYMVNCSVNYTRTLFFFAGSCSCYPEKEVKSNKNRGSLLSIYIYFRVKFTKVVTY